MMKIAIVEDNPVIPEVLTAMLRVGGYQSEVFDSGASVLPILLADDPPPYDLLILDYLLPGGVSGLDILEAVRRHPSSKTLPIILISAADQGILAQVEALYPDVPVLRKPFPSRSLFALIEKLTHRHPLDS
jgi:DNA-binding response OmpR family regulator